MPDWSTLPIGHRYFKCMRYFDFRLLSISTPLYQTVQMLDGSDGISVAIGIDGSSYDPARCVFVTRRVSGLQQHDIGLCKMDIFEFEVIPDPKKRLPGIERHVRGVSPVVPAGEVDVGRAQ